MYNSDDEDKAVLDVRGKKPILYAPYAHSQDTALRLENKSKHMRLGWKVKTTNNQRYKMRPVCGILAPGDVVEVYVQIEPITDENPDDIRDAIGVFAKDAQSYSDRFSVWKGDNKDDIILQEDVKLYFVQVEQKEKKSEQFFNHVSVDNTQEETSVQ